MGKVIMSGIAPKLEVPSGVMASDLAVGSSVYLNENGSPVEYLVVNKGIPRGSSLYDSSCDGTWLLRKALYEKRAWDSSNNDYENSDIHAYLTSTFLSLFDSNIRSAIKQAKIPYQKGTGPSGSVAFGSNGLSTKVFLLSCCEVGGIIGVNSLKVPEDGACLEYFNVTSGTDPKRIAYYDGTATDWWLRSPYTGAASYAGYSSTTGDCNTVYTTGSNGIRPALILPNTAYFDEETLLFKGVA